MKNIKLLIVLGAVSLFIIGAISWNFLSNSNMNNETSDTLSGQDGNQIKQNTESSSSLQDVLNSNNQELLNLIDTRKTVIFALYGTDEKNTETGRSDIIMVVMYDPTQKKLIMASIPRDSRVNIPGYGLDKINHAFAYGGRALSDQTIEELLGIKLDFSLNLDFDTFSKIIDSVGGVSINAKKNFYYNEDNSLAIKAGSQILNGRDALFYVRFRYDEEGDYGRIARQQEVIISLMEAIKKMSLKEKIKLVETFYNKGIETNAKIAKIEEYINMSSGDQTITYENYRLKTYSQLIDGLWYELYSQEDLDAIKNLFKSDNGGMNLETWN